MNTIPSQIRGKTIAVKRKKDPFRVTDGNRGSIREPAVKMSPIQDLRKYSRRKLV